METINTRKSEKQVIEQVNQEVIESENQVNQPTVPQ